ncbi:MAG: glycosyltransferase [Burkholderiaceae bacterium]|nr:glycosyltransferase [Microbacteriaceae bacterium]
MTGTPPTGTPVIVLQSVRAFRSTTNPYLVQLVAAMPHGVATEMFTWRRAITGRYDVLHAHWPEVLLRGRSGVLRHVARLVLFSLLLARIRSSRIVVVRTLHNVGTHEAEGPLHRWLLDNFDSATTLWVRLNPQTVLPRPREARTIPHGHYRDWFPVPSDSVVPGRILCFGLIRPYKGVEALLGAFRRVADVAASLHVVGKPASSALDAEVRALAAGDPRIALTLDYVDDPTLAAEVGEAQLVILPYRNMHNSGALLLALSLDRPVLVPGNIVTRDLAAEVGTDWVMTFDGELTAQTVSSALDWSAAPRQAGPDLSRREWSVIGEQHAEAYRAAITPRGRTR